MKYLKMLGLTAVAALSIAAFAGAGTASASSLCKVNESPCAAPFTGEVVGKSAEATLTAGSFVVKCASEAKGSLNASGVGKITNLTFSSCKGECTTATALNLPYKAVGDAAGGGNGTLLVSKETVGPPGAKLGGCTFLKVNCAYVAETEPVSLAVTGGASPTLKATAVPLKRTEGPCPEKGTWTATYSVTPAPLFLVA
jgi:hypothetical protein